MRNRFYSWPIRVHLTILIVLLAVPSISLIIYSGISERRDAIAGAKIECLMFVNSIESQQQAMVAGAQQLVTALSVLPQIQSRNPAATNALLADLLRKNPQYTNIIVGDRSGLVWASGIPLEGKMSVADRKHYQDAMRTGRFSSGEFSIGRATGKSVMMFGYPVRNASNESIAVIGLTFDLDYAQRMFEKLNLPPGASFSLLDHRGSILIRNLKDAFSEKLVGRRDIKEENFTKMKEGPDEGTFESMGNDDKPRLVAYKKLGLPHESKPYLYIRSSIPLTSATSKANAAMSKNLSIFVSLFLIGLFLAWFMGKRVIVKPLMALKRASEQLAAGTDTIHVSQVVKGGELGELARTFDSMAEALVQRERAKNVAEGALRQSEQRWATTLASVGDAVIATDVEGKITFMNATAEKLTGWTISEAATKPATEVFNIINELTRKQVENPITKILREGMVVGLANHTILVRKDGTEVPIDDSGAPIRDREGKTLGVVLVFHDITDRKQAEEAIRKSEEKYRHLVEHSPTAIYEIDFNERRLKTINEGMCKMLGYTEAELLAMNPMDLLDKESGEIFLDRMRQAQAGETPPDQIEYKGKRKDGSYLWGILHTKFKYTKGKIVGAFVVAHDITERKRVEEEANRLLAAVQEEKERLSALVNSISDEVWFADTQKKFTLVNPSAQREFSFSSVNALDVKKLAERLEVYRPDGSLRPFQEAPPLRALRGEVVTNQEEIIRTPRSGELRHRQVSAAPVRDGGGHIIGSVSVVRDITELKQAEARVSRSQKTFSELVERSPFGTYIVDSQFRIAMMNAASQDGAFRNVRPVIGRDFAEAMRILWPEPVAAEIIGHFRRTLETGEPFYSPRFINPRQDVGIVESYEWELHRMTLPDEQYGVICYYFDSTRLREAEEALRVRSVELQHLTETLEDRVKGRTAELANLSSRLVSAQENERRRVSYDLHDNVWQTLLAIRFNIESLFSEQDKPDWAALRKKSKEVTEDILGAVGKIRSMQGDLWPYVLDDIGLVATIDWYCREFSKNHSGLAIERKSDFTEGEIPSPAKIVIYRILQETLSNVAKHSQARHVTIRLMRKDHGMEFTVEDNGIGFDPEETIARKAPWGGLGLLSIKMRTELSGGIFGVESLKGKGTTVHASWPI